MTISPNNEQSAIRQARLSGVERLHQASGVRSGKSKWLLHTTGNLILQKQKGSHIELPSNNPR